MTAFRLPCRQSDPRDIPAGRFGRGHAGKANERGDADRDGANDRKEELPDCGGHHHLGEPRGPVISDRR